MKTNTSKGYKVTTVNNTITAIYEVENGKIEQKTSDDNASWQLLNNQLIKTETEHGHIKTTVYTNSDGDGLYTKAVNTASANSALITAQTDDDSNDRHSITLDNSDDHALLADLDHHDDDNLSDGVDRQDTFLDDSPHHANSEQPVVLIGFAESLYLDVYS